MNAPQNAPALFEEPNGTPIARGTISRSGQWDCFETATAGLAGRAGHITPARSNEGFPGRSGMLVLAATNGNMTSYRILPADGIA